MAIRTKRVVARSGMSASVPALMIGEIGWDIDLKRFRVGDDTTSPPYVMTSKSLGIFEYNFITYVQYPEIRMLPKGTVDGVDISELNANNGLVTRRGPNLWAHRSIVTNDPQYVKITNGNGVSGNPTIDLSDEFKYDLSQYLKTVAVDDITIHGNGRPESPLYAHTANNSERGVVRLATTQETINGVDPTIAITPFGLNARTATTERTGIVELATAQETIDGVSGDRAITPAALQQKTATEQRLGITRIATYDEVKAGQEAFAYLTPQKFNRYLNEEVSFISALTFGNQIYNAYATSGGHNVPIPTNGRDAFIAKMFYEPAGGGLVGHGRISAGTGGSAQVSVFTYSDWGVWTAPDYEAGTFVRYVVPTTMYAKVFKKRNIWYLLVNGMALPLGGEDGTLRFVGGPYATLTIYEAGKL